MRKTKPHRIPRDVEYRDYPLLGPFSAQQVGYLLLASLVAWNVWDALAFLPPAARLAAVALILSAGLALAVARWRGDSLTAWLYRALAFYLPRRERGYRKDGCWSTQTWVEVVGIAEDGLVRLTGSGFCLILGVSAINFDLRTDHEKEALLVAYRQFLNSLTFPVQILCVTELLALEEHFAGLPAGEPLAEDYVRFAQDLVQQQRILRRRYFVVLPWFPPTQDRIALRRWARKSAGATELAARRARWELEERKQAVQAGLERLGLKVHRLSGEEAAALLGKCYSPGRLLPTTLPNPYDELDLVVGRRDPYLDGSLNPKGDSD